MTEPQQQNTNTQAAPPHATPPPAQQQQQQQPRPVVVQQNDPGLHGIVQDMNNRLTALPESIVNAFREATSTPPANAAQGQAQPPQQATQGQAQGAQQRTQQTHDANVAKTGYKGPGRVARWYLGLGKGDS